MLGTLLRLGSVAGVFFLTLAVLVEMLGYVTWSLTPRDADSLQRATGFEKMMAGGSSSAQSDGFKYEVPDRYPDGSKAIHSVSEWPKARERSFQQAPMYGQYSDIGTLPPVNERLPENPLVITPPHQNGPYGGTWPRFATGPQDIGIIKARFAYEGLVRWGPMARQILPNLAVSWTVEDSARTFTFELRRGVRWSDGHLFSADDILFWYEHVIQHPDLMPTLPSAFSRGGELMELEKMDEYRIRFRFKRSHGLFLKAMASGQGYEMADFPAHYLKQYHPDFTPLHQLEAMAEEAGFDFWYQLWGDKRDWRNIELPRLWPWIIKEPPPTQPVVFERNPYYWKVDPEGSQLPYIDRMTFEIYDIETINLKAINGEVGMQSRHMSFTNYPLFMENRDKGGYRVLHWVSGSGGANILGINLNHKDPILRAIVSDRRFRIALSHAIDRDALNEASFFGIGQPRQVSPPPTSEYYSSEYEEAYISYDVEMANRLLDEMGLTERNNQGVRLRPDGDALELSVETTAMNSRTLELIAGYWTAVGVKTRIKELARQLFYQRKAALMHDVGVWGGADEQIPTLDPRWFIPYSSESIHGIGYARWYRSSGTKGETPEGDLRRVIELYQLLEETPDDPGQIRLFSEILALNQKNLWVIGTVGGLPSMVLVKNTFKNVPEVAMSGWSFRTPGNTAVECYAIDER